MTRPVAYARTLAACPLLALSLAFAVAQVAATTAAETVAGVRS